MYTVAEASAVSKIASGLANEGGRGETSRDRRSEEVGKREQIDGTRGPGDVRGAGRNRTGE